MGRSHQKMESSNTKQSNKSGGGAVVRYCVSVKKDNI